MREYVSTFTKARPLLIKILAGVLSLTTRRYYVLHWILVLRRPWNGLLRWAKPCGRSHLDVNLLLRQPGWDSTQGKDFSETEITMDDLHMYYTPALCLLLAIACSALTHCANAAHECTENTWYLQDFPEIWETRFKNCECRSIRTPNLSHPKRHTYQCSTLPYLLLHWIKVM